MRYRSTIVFERILFILCKADLCLFLESRDGAVDFMLHKHHEKSQDAVGKRLDKYLVSDKDIINQKKKSDL